VNSKVINLSLIVLCGILFIVALYLVFMWVPTEANQGIVQRVFYFHVPSAWVAFLAFFLVFLGGLVYLKKRDPRWDIMAYSAAEIGVVFTTITLISGVIWAKPIWFVWWTWDARLTSTLVLWLMYVGYLLVRAYAPASQGFFFFLWMYLLCFFLSGGGEFNILLQSLAAVPTQDYRVPCY